MKTIEERAREYAPEPLNDHYAIPALIAFKNKRQAYIAGATEQKLIDDVSLQERFKKVLNEQKWDLIDKACNWLDRYLHLFVMKGHINHSALEQEFRKSMEE